MQRKLLDFEATDQLPIMHSAFIKYFRKNGNKMKQCISSLGETKKKKA
jgi:hypothetical protein